MKVRPPLTTSNIDTWRPEFRALWDDGPWFYIGLPDNLPDPPPSDIRVLHPEGGGPSDCPTHVVLSLSAFSFPGPCGLVAHILYAGRCDACQFVFWMPGPLVPRAWAASDLAGMAKLQDKPHEQAIKPAGANPRPPDDDDPPPVQSS